MKSMTSDGIMLEKKRKKKIWERKQVLPSKRQELKQE